MLIELMALMWQTDGRLPDLKGLSRSELYEVVARMTGHSPDKVRESMRELLKHKRIFFDDEDVLCCTKLMEIADKQRVMSDRGKLGGNPQLKQKVKHPVKPKAKAKEQSQIQIPSTLKDDRFTEACNEWLSHKKAKKSSMTDLAQKKALKKLAAMGLERALAAIDHSIANNYQGIFEEKSPDSKSPTEQAIEKEAQESARIFRKKLPSGVTTAERNKIAREHLADVKRKMGWRTEQKVKELIA